MEENGDGLEEDGAGLEESLDRTGSKASELTWAAGRLFQDLVRQDADGGSWFLDGGKDKVCHMMGCGSRGELSRVTPRSLPEAGSTAEGQV